MAIPEPRYINIPHERDGCRLKNLDALWDVVLKFMLAHLDALLTLAVVLSCFHYEHLNEGRLKSSCFGKNEPVFEWRSLQTARMRRPQFGKSRPQVAHGRPSTAVFWLLDFPPCIWTIQNPKTLKSASASVGFLHTVIGKGTAHLQSHALQIYDLSRDLSTFAALEPPS